MWANPAGLKGKCSFGLWLKKRFKTLFQNFGVFFLFGNSQHLLEKHWSLDLQPSSWAEPLFAQEGPGAAADGERGLWNYSSLLNFESKALDGLKEKMHTFSTCATHSCVRSDLQRQSGPRRRDPGICCCSQCCEKPPFRRVFLGYLSDVSGQAAAPGTTTAEGKTCLFGVTHLVGVLRVELGLHVLFFLGRSCLAALAGGRPSLPLCTCTHHESLNVGQQSKPGSGVALMWLGSWLRGHFLQR